MSADFQYDVFLSHNQADKARVRRLAEGLWVAGCDSVLENDLRARNLT